MAQVRAPKCCDNSSSSSSGSGIWVNKPQNSALWHRTIFEWLADYLKH